MKVLYHGCDAFYVSFKGRISSLIRDKLRASKALAMENGQPQPIEIGGALFHVMATGAQGGYAFRVDGGEMGVKYLIKDNGDPENWNIYAQAHAEYLATVSIDEVQIKMRDDLELLGGYIMGESVSRFDYAVDLDAPDFEPNPANIIAHSKTYISPYYETDEPQEIAGSKDMQIGLSGRKISSITIGRMPGRQIQIYNKRKEAIAKGKSFWLKAWGRKKEDKRAVWRVEIRLGKKHLKEHYGLDSFNSFNASFLDVIKDALASVRYVTKVNESNPERSPLSAIWRAVTGVMTNKLRLHSSGLTRGALKHCLKSDRLRILKAQWEGLGASICAVLDDGINPERFSEMKKYHEIRRGVFSRYMQSFAHTIISGRHWQSFCERVDKSRDKVIFLDGNNYNYA